MSSPNDQNPHHTPTRNTQPHNWIQMQSDMPLHSPSSQGYYPTPSPPPQGYYPTPSPPPQGYYQPPPQGYYPPQAPPQGYYVPQSQTFHPQQSFTDLLTQHDGLETINPSLSQPHSTPSQAPSEDTSNKQKAKGKGKQKAKSRDWSIDECEALAKSWIHISEDAVVGRGQQLRDFWNRVTKSFNERMDYCENHRPKDQVYSKYSKMNPEVAYFNDTFLSVSKTNPSGWNETKILQRVNKIYVQERGKPFPFPTVWEIVRYSEKWKEDCDRKKRGAEDDEEEDEPSHPSKKSRTSGSDFSDAHIGFNLNEFAAPSPPDEPQEPRVQPRARPAGRDKSKAQARDKGKSKEAPPELQNKVAELNEKLDRLLGSEEAKREQRDMRLLFLDTSHMSGATLAAAEKVKAKIRAKYNLDD